MTANDDENSLVLVVGYEGSDPARRALAAAGRILGARAGWIEVVYVKPTEGGPDYSSGPSADVLDSLGPAGADLHYEVRSLLEAEKQPWRLRSTSGAVAEELFEAAQAIAREGGPSRTVAIVIGSDRRLMFSVPVTLARQSGFPVVIVPLRLIAKERPTCRVRPCRMRSARSGTGRKPGPASPRRRWKSSGRLSRPGTGCTRCRGTCG